MAMFNTYGALSSVINPYASVKGPIGAGSGILSGLQNAAKSIGGWVGDEQKRIAEADAASEAVRMNDFTIANAKDSLSQQQAATNASVSIANMNAANEINKLNATLGVDVGRANVANIYDVQKSNVANALNAQQLNNANSLGWQKLYDARVADTNAMAAKLALTNAGSNAGSDKLYSKAIGPNDLAKYQEMYDNNVVPKLKNVPREVAKIVNAATGMGYKPIDVQILDVDRSKGEKSKYLATAVDMYGKYYAEIITQYENGQTNSNSAPTFAPYMQSQVQSQGQRQGQTPQITMPLQGQSNMQQGPILSNTEYSTQQLEAFHRELAYAEENGVPFERLSPELQNFLFNQVNKSSIGDM